MRSLAWALLLCSNAAVAAPRILYSKFFKGSVPEYSQIVVERNGQTTYQEAKEDDNPIKLQLSESDTRDIFALVEKLDHFTRQLESGLKVANMGAKTFRYEDSKDQHEVVFNYSEDVNAQALQDWFERIAESEQVLISLDRTVHYDKLGVNESILLLQVTLDRKRLVAPEQFLPLLDRVVKNESYLHMARERAAELAETIRKTPPAAAPGKNQ